MLSSFAAIAWIVQYSIRLNPLERKAYNEMQTKRIHPRHHTEWFVAAAAAEPTEKPENWKFS